MGEGNSQIKVMRMLKKTTRPVSLLSNINEIIERILFQKVNSFFLRRKNNILVKEQCVFRKGKSTILAVYQVLQSAIKAINEKNFTVAVGLDL